MAASVPLYRVQASQQRAGECLERMLLDSSRQIDAERGGRWLASFAAALLGDDIWPRMRPGVNIRL